MGTFADRYIAGLTESELDLYEEILTYPDPDIYNWVTGLEQMPANFMNSVMEKLLQHRVI